MILEFLILFLLFSCGTPTESIARSTSSVQTITTTTSTVTSTATTPATSFVWDSDFQQETAQDICDNSSSVPPQNQCYTLFKYCGSCHGSWVTSMPSLSLKKTTLLQHLQGTLDPMPRGRWQAFYNSPEGKDLINWFKIGMPK